MEEASQHWVLRRIVEALQGFRAGDVSLDETIEQISIAASIADTDVPHAIRDQLLFVTVLPDELALNYKTEQEALEELDKLEDLLTAYKKPPLYGPPDSGHAP